MEAETDFPSGRIVERQENGSLEGDERQATIPPVRRRDFPSSPHSYSFRWHHQQLHQREPLQPFGDPFHGASGMRINGFSGSMDPISRNSFNHGIGCSRAPHSNPDHRPVYTCHHKGVSSLAQQNVSDGRSHGAQWNNTFIESRGYNPTWPSNNIFTVASKPRISPSAEVETSGLGSPHLVCDVGQWDIVCGRGIGSHVFPGNAWFRDLVEEHQIEYLACRRADKPSVARKIMGIVVTRGGRFLKRMKLSQTGELERYGWVEIEGSRVYEKVCQALREGAPKIREQMLMMTKPENLEKENFNKKEQSYV